MSFCSHPCCSLRLTSFLVKYRFIIECALIFGPLKKKLLEKSELNVEEEKKKTITSDKSDDEKEFGSREQDRENPLHHKSSSSVSSLAPCLFYCVYSV